MTDTRPVSLSAIIPELAPRPEKPIQDKEPETAALLRDCIARASDSARLRRAGIATFGVSGTFGEIDLGNAPGAHERLPVASFHEGVEFLYCLVKTLAESPSTAESPKAGGLPK
jgi:hypothetical protein